MRRTFLIVLVFFMIFFSQLVGAEKIIITIPEKVEITQSWITLGVIAQIDGADEVTELKRLRSIELGKALLPGYARELPREYISLAIQEKGFLLASFELKMPHKVIVKTASKYLSKDNIIDYAENYILEQLNCSKDMVQIIPKFTPPDLVLPAKPYTLEIVLGNQENFLGNISLQVLVKIDGQIYQRVFLGLEVKMWQQVYIAKRMINRGEKVSKDDFSFEKRAISHIYGELITDLNNTLIKDGIVSIPIKKGEVLTDYYLSLPDIIFNGDIIQAEVQVGSISITTLVKARQNGKKGEYILVENLNTGSQFKAEIINAHFVRVVN